MKEIKLSKKNSSKECPRCGIVEIVMQGLNGHCPICNKKIYTIDSRIGGVFR